MSSKTEIPDVKTQLKILYEVAVWEHRKLPSYLKTQCPVEELQNAGYLGLVEAVAKYDPDNVQECSFATFARRNIKFAIWTFLQSNGLIRLPKQVRADLKKIKNCVERLFIKFERYPTPDEISEEMAIPLQEVKKMLLYATQIGHFDDEPGGSSETADLNLLSIEEEIIFVAFGKDLEDCLTTVLTQKEIIVLLLKEVIGLTLEQISKLLGDEVNITKVWRTNQHALELLNKCLEQKGWPKLIE